MTTAPCPRVGRPTRAPTRPKRPSATPSPPCPRTSPGRRAHQRPDWRTGLTAFITLVTTGRGHQGPGGHTCPDDQLGISTTVLVVGGSLSRFWPLAALAAEAGTAPKKQNLTDIRATYGTLVPIRSLRQVTPSASRLGETCRRRCSHPFLVGIATTWWAPPPRDPLAFLQVVEAPRPCAAPCQSADSGELRSEWNGFPRTRGHPALRDHQPQARERLPLARCPRPAAVHFGARWAEQPYHATQSRSRPDTAKSALAALLQVRG